MFPTSHKEQENNLDDFSNTILSGDYTPVDSVDDVIREQVSTSGCLDIVVEEKENHIESECRVENEDDLKILISNKENSQDIPTGRHPKLFTAEEHNCKLGIIHEEHESENEIPLKTGRHPKLFTAQEENKKLTTIHEEHESENDAPANEFYNSSDEDPKYENFKNGSMQRYFSDGKYLTDMEKSQLEFMFRSLKTDVFVCGCPATMYFCGPLFKCDSKSQHWIEHLHGVPVVVLEDNGPTNKLWLYLAERGTGLPLWRERLTFQSAYRKEENDFHVLSISSNHCIKVGLSFTCDTSATRLWVHISRLTSRLENIAVSLPRTRGRRNNRKQWLKPRPNKLQISIPVYFQHITSISTSDKDRFYSLKHFLPEDKESQSDE